MHWRLDWVRALSLDEYEVLVEMVKDATPEPD